MHRYASAKLILMEKLEKVDSVWMWIF